MRHHINASIRTIRKKRGFDQKSFADLLNIQVNTYGKIERGEIKLTVDRLYEIAHLLDVTPNEILNFHNKPVLQRKNDRWNVAYVPIESWSDRLTELKELPATQHYFIPGISGANNFMIAVDGDSMFPTLSNGDYIIIKRLKTTNIRWGEIYVIDTIDGIFVKRLFQHRKYDNQIELHSDNCRYKTYSILKDDILSVWSIKENITKNFTPKKQKSDKLRECY
jgi:transcriptional regulator with XRE-family HTH domain